MADFLEEFLDKTCLFKATETQFTYIHFHAIIVLIIGEYRMIRMFKEIFTPLPPFTVDLVRPKIDSNVSALDGIKNLSWKAKLAGICFILGKLQSIVTVSYLFSGNPSVIWSLCVYIGLILAAIVLSIIDMFAQKKNDEKKEKEKDLQKDYDLLLKKYNELVFKNQ